MTGGKHQIEAVVAKLGSRAPVFQDPD